MKNYTDKTEIFINQKQKTIQQTLKTSFVKSILYEKALKTQKDFYVIS